MNKTILIMVQELRATLRRKTFLFFGFGLPILMGIIVLIIMIVNRDAAEASLLLAAEEITVDQLEQEGLVDEGSLVSFLPSNVPQDWLLIYQDEASAEFALEAGDISAYYVIPADYLESGDIKVVKATHNPIEGVSNIEGIEWILMANLLGEEAAAARVWNPINVEMTSLAPVDEGETEDAWVSELLPNLMALILYLVIIMSSSVLVMAMTDEKKNRVIELLVSSVSTRQLITGKIVAVGILGLLIMILWLVIMWSVTKFGGQPLAIPENFSLPTTLLAWALIYGMFGFAIYGAQMAGLGALAPDIKDSRSISFIIMIPLIAVYMFLIAIIANPDGPIAIVLSLFPLTSPVGMITRMTVTDVPTWQAVLAAILQLLGAIIIVRIVIRLFHAQILLSGQPISVKRYFGVLLGGK